MPSRPTTRSTAGRASPEDTTRTPRTRIANHKRRRIYHRLDRSDRSKIRILRSQGWNQSEISSEIGCTVPCIGKVLQKSTKSARKDDVSEDWQFVDDNFRERFLHKPNSESTAGNVSEEEENDPKQGDVNEAYDEKDILLDNETEVIPATPKRMPLVHGALDTSLNTNMDRAPRECSVAVLATAERGNPVQRFLATLDRWHDLSFIYDTLKKQRLGDKNKLLALANFSEPEMHSIFKEALPDITVAERYVLVKGLKKHARNDNRIP